MIKLKKSGLLTKIVLLLLLIFIGVSFLNLRGRIADARLETQLLSEQLEEQARRNTELANDIENSDDPEHLKDIAREKLDLLEPGEKVFYVTD